ncbi:MAG: hypothetical protein WA821_16295 [Anaerolineales bacterium]
MLFVLLLFPGCLLAGLEDQWISFRAFERIGGTRMSDFAYTRCAPAEANVPAAA